MDSSFEFGRDLAITIYAVARFHLAHPCRVCGRDMTVLQNRPLDLVSDMAHERCMRGTHQTERARCIECGQVLKCETAVALGRCMRHAKGTEIHARFTRRVTRSNWGVKPGE